MVPFPVSIQQRKKLVLIHKSPIAPLDTFEITLFDPPFPFVSVTAARPTP